MVNTNFELGIIGLRQREGGGEGGIAETDSGDEGA